jgi:hypothetical protein
MRSGIEDCAAAFYFIAQGWRTAVMRALLHFLSLVFLIAAVIAGVSDTVQSFAVDKMTLTTGFDVWQFLSDESYAALRSWMSSLRGGAILDQGLDRLVLQPAFALLLGLSLIFWIVGYKKPKPAGRFSV